MQNPNPQRNHDKSCSLFTGIGGLFALTAMLSLLITVIIPLSVWASPDSGLRTYILESFDSQANQYNAPTSAAFVMTVLTLYATQIHNGGFHLMPNPKTLYYQIFSATKIKSNKDCRNAVNSIRGYVSLLLAYYVPKHVYKTKFRFSYNQLLTYLRFKSYLTASEVDTLTSQPLDIHCEIVAEWIINLLKNNQIKKKKFVRFLIDLNELKIKYKPVSLMHSMFPYAGILLAGTSVFYCSDFSKFVSLKIMSLKIIQLWATLTAFIYAYCISDPYATRNFCFKNFIPKEDIQEFYNNLDDLFEEQLRLL